MQKLIFTKIQICRNTFHSQHTCCGSYHPVTTDARSPTEGIRMPHPGYSREEMSDLTWVSVDDRILQRVTEFVHSLFTTNNFFCFGVFNIRGNQIKLIWKKLN